MKQLAVVGFCGDDGKARILLKLLGAVVCNRELGSQQREFKFTGGSIILFPPIDGERMFAIHADETGARTVLRVFNKACKRLNYRWRCSAAY